MDWSVERLFRYFLIFITVLLIIVNTLAPWSVYQKRMLIMTDNPSGSSLAERYLILGDWPSSSTSHLAVDEFERFSVYKKETTK